MLQQTRVATVMPRYQRWLARFPSVDALAAASLDEVLEEWAGLGYYSRARRLHQGARYVVAQGWPTCADEWRGVPGVGRYTAGALAAIVLGHDTPAVDGNVVRVYARVYADAGPNPERRAWKWAEGVVPAGRGAEWNQALMELGATLCLPQNPKCPQCPVASHCAALRMGKPGDFPRRRKVASPTEVQATVLAHVSGGMIGLRSVPEGQWWQGLKEVPTSIGPETSPGQPIGTVLHTVTRHRIVAEVRVSEEQPGGLEWHPLASDPPGVSALSRKAIRLVREHYEYGRNTNTSGTSRA